MYLRDLSLHVTPDAILPDGLRERDFNITTHAVQETFLSFLPAKFNLDNCGKINVDFGAHGQRARYEKWQGIATYSVEHFPFAEYFNCQPLQRDEMLLRALECGLLDIAKQCGAETEPIYEASRATRACEFAHRYRIKRLSRQTESRLLMLNVYRNIFHSGESWEIEITNRKKEILQRVWIAEKTDFVASAYDFRSSIWEGDTFVVIGHTGQATFKLDVSKLVAINAGI